MIQCQLEYRDGPAMSAMFCIDEMCANFPVDLTEPLYTAIKGLPVSRIFNSVLNAEPFADQIYWLRDFNFDFLPHLYVFCKKKVCTVYFMSTHTSRYSYSGLHRIQQKISNYFNISNLNMILSSARTSKHTGPTKTPVYWFLP